LDLNLTGGIQWIPGSTVLYPFTVSLDGAFTKFFQYQSSAGYLVNNYYNFNAWKDYSFLELSEGIDKGWFWDGKFSLTPFDYIELSIRWAYSNMDSFMTMDPDSYNSINGQYSVSGFQDNYLDLSPFVNVSLGSEWGLLIGWDGQLLNTKNNLKPVHSVYSELIFNGDLFDFLITGNYSLEPLITIPVLSFGVDFPLTDGVTLGIEGGDILGFFTEDRTVIDNYISEGGNLSLLTKISL